jgi:hypothetical protein
MSSVLHAFFDRRRKLRQSRRRRVWFPNRGHPYDRLSMADQPLPNGSNGSGGSRRDGDRSLVPGGLPSRGAYVLAFLSVVFAGAFGGIIGYGLTDLGCEGDCGVAVIGGLVVGGLIAAIGVGVVAILVLRAMAEWQRGGKRAR